MGVNYGGYGYEYAVSGAAVGGAVAGALIIPLIISLGVSVLLIISMWKLFKKAGKNGWEAIIPIYNYIVLLDIAGYPAWNIVFLLIPVYQIIFMIKVFIDFAKKFGKDTGFGVLLVFFAPICFPILAFSKDTQYVGSTGPVPTSENTLNQNPAYVGQTPADAATTTQINQGNFETQPEAPAAPEVAAAPIAAAVAEPAPVEAQPQSAGFNVQPNNFNGTVAGMPTSQYATPAPEAPVGPAPAEPVAAEPVAEPAPVVAETPAVEEAPAAPVTEAAPVATNATKACPTCGAQLPADAAFCGSCGTQL